MKNIYISIIFLFISYHCVYAQSKINLGTNLRLGYPSVIKGNPDEFSLPKAVTSTIKGIFLVSIGGDLEYSLSKKITLQTGLNASFSKYKQEYFGFIQGADWDPTTGISHKSVTKNSLNIMQMNMPIIFKYFGNCLG